MVSCIFDLFRTVDNITRILCSQQVRYVSGSQTARNYIQAAGPKPPADVKQRTIGHYILGRTIGEGTFGKVKLATHILTGESVAVKILEKERIVGSTDVERVSREIKILKMIRHPHVIQMFEIMDTPRQLYLIMEYASGGELFDYIVANNRLPEVEACKFFHQIIAGVEEIHLKGIVHRDLKPENLLLDNFKNLKLVDFGLSNLYKRGQLLTTACGSPCYAAPEMIAGKKYTPHLCDIWSCGIILYASVVGCLPFEDKNTSSLYRKILSGQYRSPSFLSSSCKRLISRLLDVDPSRRIDFDGIRMDPWFNGSVFGNSEMPVKFRVGFGCEVPTCTRCMKGDIGQELDKEILKTVESYGFASDEVRQSLEKNKHNHATTTYYLLFNKKNRLQTNFSLDSPVRPISVPPVVLKPKPVVSKIRKESSQSESTETKKSSANSSRRSSVTSNTTKKVEKPKRPQTSRVPFVVSKATPVGKVTRKPKKEEEDTLVTTRCKIPGKPVFKLPEIKNIVATPQTSRVDPSKYPVLRMFEPVPFQPRTTSVESDRAPSVRRQIMFGPPIGPADYGLEMRNQVASLISRNNARVANMTGGYDFRCVLKRPSRISTQERLFKTLKNNSLMCRNVGPNLFQCENQNFKLLLHIQEIQNGPLINIKKINVGGDMMAFNALCNKIVIEM